MQNVVSERLRECSGAELYVLLLIEVPEIDGRCVKEVDRSALFLDKKSGNKMERITLVTNFLPELRVLLGVRVPAQPILGRHVLHANATSSSRRAGG
jgi:hypothetical protein